MDSCPLCPEGVTCLSPHQLVGLAFMSQTACISMAADFIILLFVFNNLRRHKWRISGIFRSPLDIFILSLIVSDLFQGLGSALIIRWIVLEQVLKGTYCTVQGSFQSLGETSSAMATLAIAVYTFWVIAFRSSGTGKGTIWGMRISVAIVALIWLYVVSFVSYVESRKPGGWNEPDPYWCWIGHEHVAAQLAGEYVWLWVAGLASIVLYVPLVFIVWGGCRCWRGKGKDTKDGGKEKGKGKEREEAPPIGTGMNGDRAQDLEAQRMHYIQRMEQVANRATISNPSSRQRDRPFRSDTLHLTGSTLTPSGMERMESFKSPILPHSQARRRASPPHSPPQSRSSPQNRISTNGLALIDRELRASSSHSNHHAPLSSTSLPHPSPTHTTSTPARAKISLQILLYPLLYTALVLPLSIARWTSGFSLSAIQQHPTGDRTTFTASAVYNLSGLVNALLVVLIRRGRGFSLLKSPECDKDEEEMELTEIK